MRMLRPALWILVCLVVATSLSAQQSSATSDPQAVSFLDSSLAKLTGGAPVNDVTMSGTVTVNHGTSKESGTITMEATSTGQSQIIVNLPSGKWVTTADYAANPRISSTSGPNGVSNNYTPGDLMGPSPAWFFPSFLISGVSPANYVASYRGDEETNGSTFHRIWIRNRFSHSTLFQSVGRQILNQPQQPVRAGQLEMYLDSSSFLPGKAVLGITGYKAKNGKADLASPVENREVIQYSDYRQVQGQLTPFHMNVIIGVTPAMRIQVSSVIFNSGAIVGSN